MTEPREHHNIALVGFMGTGKSSVSHLLGSLLHFSVVDTDSLIEERAGKRITEIFRTDGEPAFRQWESRIAHEVKDRRHTVISTGGGLVINPDNMAALKETCLVVCLWASPEAIWERVRHQSHRPLLNTADPLERIRALLAEREPSYREADVLVNTEMRSAKEVAHQIAHHWQNHRA